jgi:GxxExxY protein
MDDLICREESYKIIGICMDIYNTLGMGFDEVVYKDALEIEFKRQGIPYLREKEYNIMYKGIDLNRKYYVDFVVFNEIILEVKSKSMIVEPHLLQTKNYCACAQLRLGIVVNFGSTSLQHKRVLNYVSQLQE